jgi:membrane associated rhomboid family serine protease
MPAQMTPIAPARGKKNATIVFVGLIIFVGLASYAIAVLTNRSLVVSSGLGGAVLAVLSFTAFFGLWLRDRRRRDVVILDCGPHPTKWLFLMLAPVIPLLGISSMMIEPSERTMWTLGVPALMLFQGPFFAIMGFGRLQVTEQGFWQ